jgi:hypothetical protein
MVKLGAAVPEGVGRRDGIRLVLLSGFAVWYTLYYVLQMPISSRVIYTSGL